MPLHVRIVPSSSKIQCFVTGATGPLATIRRLWAQEGAVQVESILKALVPVKTGTLRDSFTSNLTPAGFKVYPTASYAGFVDQGTAPHIIRARAGGVLHWIDSASGEDRFARSVHHPGTRALHFMEGAREPVKDALRQLFIDKWNEAS